MKKLLSLAITAILIFGLVACSTTEGAPETSTESSQTQATFEAPTQLFEEYYNLFADIDWPEGYTVYQASYESNGYHLFRLYLTATGTTEDVITFFSTFGGDNTQESINQNIEMFLANEFVIVHGTQRDEGIGADIEITPTYTEDNNYEYVDGFNICLVSKIDESKTADYKNALDVNFNEPAAAALSSYIDLSDFDAQELKVNSYRPLAEIMSVSIPEDYASVKGVILSDTKQFNPMGDNHVGFDYGDMSVQLIFDDEKKAIYLFECLGDASANLRDYTPEKTLKNLGFNLYGENCSYETDDVWFAVYKNEWGSDDNSIKCTFEIFGKPCFVLISYPDQIYTVMIGEEDERIDYTYDAFADTVTPTKLFEDYAAFKSAFEEMTGETSDMSVKEPVMFVDNFAYDTFGLKPESLFELPME